MKKCGMVLEGGATRGVFTAGVLDCLMEAGISVPYVAGVSAGACNAVDFVSGQIGRTRDCMIIKEKAYRYISAGNLVRHHTVFDMDMIFDKYPNQYMPFDYEAFFQNPTECELVVTNCLTGGAEYLSEKKSGKRLMDICRASSSIPLFTPMVFVDGVPYLDGGLADSVPVVRALRKGYKKNLIILTRGRGYRKKAMSVRETMVVKTYYRKYPSLVAAILLRPYKYNKIMEFIDRLEREGRAYVLRPQIKEVSRTERSIERLTSFYEHGFETAQRELAGIRDYIG